MKNIRSRVPGAVLAAALGMACSSTSPTSIYGTKADAAVGGDTEAGSFGGGDGGVDPSEMLKGDAGGTAPMLCQTTKGTTQEVPLDLFFVVDRSGSMSDDNKWTAITGALDSFVNSPRSKGLNVALQFFPLRRFCQLEEYLTPTVPFGALPTSATLFSTALSTQSPETRTYIGTPTSIALDAAYQVANQQAAANPTHRVAVVLATDGYPQLCLLGNKPNTLSAVLDVAREAATGPYKIPTYVIGAGSLLTDLNSIAAAGNGRAVLVDTKQPNFTEDILGALESIRFSALPCEFKLDPSAGTPDPTLVNVGFRASPAAPLQSLSYVPTAADCARSTVPAWYFDDAAHPTSVMACPATCDVIKNAAGVGEVDLAIGCARKDAPLK